MAGRTSADGRGIIAVGASAGGIDAIQRLMKELPEDIEAAICVVLHIPASSRSLLPQVIARQTRLPVCQAATGLRLRPGHVYVAPPDRICWRATGRRGSIAARRRTASAPPIDPLFRSVAEGYGARGIAVVLSGSLSDGAAGAAAVAAAGGAVLVQAPVDAIVRSMPEATLAAVPQAPTFTATELTGELARRVAALPEPGEPAVPAGVELQHGAA